MKFTESDMISVAMNRQENKEISNRLFLSLCIMSAIGVILIIFGGTMGFSITIAVVAVWGAWFLYRIYHMAKRNKIEGKALFDGLPDDMKGESA